MFAQTSQKITFSLMELSAKEMSAQTSTKEVVLTTVLTQSEDTCVIALASSALLLTDSLAVRLLTKITIIKNYL